jgi:hypothetical protein
MNEIRTTGGGECKDDIAKFCASVPHAKGLLAKCLEQHLNELSDACKALASKATASGAAAPGGAPAAAGAGAAATATGAGAPPAGAPAAAPAAKPPAPAPDAAKR